MAYEKTVWESREGEGLDNYLKYDETETSVTLINAPASVTREGTPLSPENMNHIEDGIEAAHNLVAAEELARIQGDTNTLAASKNYADEQIANTVAATQKWLPAADTFAHLPAITDTSRNWLCRVRADQTVYQCIAGQTEWLQYSDQNDFVNEEELAAAVGTHNENEAAHENRFAQVIRHDEKNVPGGVLQLDENGTVPLNRLPEAFVGELGGLLDLIEGLADRLYPVGTIYESVVNRNPAEFIGGTWTVWGSGRVPVGVDTAQTEFNTAEKAGGAKTHTLSANEMPNHTHIQNTHSHSLDPHHHDVGPLRAKDLTGLTLETDVPYGFGDLPGSRYEVSSTGSNSAGIPARSTRTSLPRTNNYYTLSTTPTNQYTGAGLAHNNLQPYITCYMWKRTG